MKQKIGIPLLLLPILLACSKEKYFSGPSFYEDDFESYDSLDQLFMPYPDQDVYWSFTQLTRIENTIEVDTQMAFSGEKALRFSAVRSEEGALSKCSISKQHMAFWEGSTVRISANYYIVGTQALEWMFLLDLEENVAIGAGPGLRLALDKNRLVIEHKYNEKDHYQSEESAVEFPRDQWVELVWEVQLSQQKKGWVKVWQNGSLVLEAYNTRTMPKDLLYFQQGTKGIYSNVEFGITANSYDNDALVYVDKIKIETLP